MMPADQRFDSDDAVVSYVDLGLVNEFEFLARFDGTPLPVDQVLPL